MAGIGDALGRMWHAADAAVAGWFKDSKGAAGEAEAEAEGAAADGASAFSEPPPAIPAAAGSPSAAAQAPLSAAVVGSGDRNADARVWGAAAPPLASAPAVRFAAPLDPRAMMVDHLEHYARTTGAPDGTSISPDNTSRWIAEFVVRHFNPATYEEGEHAVYRVIDAYRFGLEQYVVTELAFRQHERLAHDAVRAALATLPAHAGARTYTDVTLLVRGMNEGINAFFGPGRVRMFEMIASGDPLPGFRESDAGFLQRRIAAYVVFKLKPERLDEARAQAEAIAETRNTLVADLQGFGMSYQAYALMLSNIALQAGLDMDAEVPFSLEHARAQLREVVKIELGHLEQMGPEKRRVGSSTVGDQRVDAQTLYDQLQAVRRGMAEREAGSFGGVEEVGEPAVAAGDAAAPADAAADADAAPVLGAESAGAAADAVVVVPASPPSTPVR